MTDKENLNDTKYLLEETDYKNTTNNNIEEQNLKNTLLNNTQLLLEEKSSIIYDIPNDINNIIQNQPKIEIKNKKDENLKKPEQENSIKDILIKNVNENYNEENEKIKDEQEIIKQQNILLNNQSTHLDELFSLSYPDFIHNRNINFTNNLYNNKIIYFGVLFPTEKVIKTINYKNDDKKKIICFQIKKNINNDKNEEKYFKILVDKNKNYFNLKANEEINIKISLEIPFIKNKKQIKCDVEIIDINNCLIDTLHLYANVEIPKLCCMRYNNGLNSKEYNIPFIQLKFNLDINNINNDMIQKFRIPLKNLSIKDLNLNLFLISNPKEDGMYKEIFDYEIYLEREKMVLFPSLDSNFFELLISIKMKADINNIKDKSNFKIKKVLGANIVDTKINYYLCLEICIIYINNVNNNI